MIQQASNTIVAVVDERGRRACADLRARFTVQYLDIETAGPDGLDPEHVVVVDVDLSKPANVRRLRSMLSGRSDGFHAFAVNYGRKVEMVHANIVGASHLIRRPVDPDELSWRLAEYVSRGARGGDDAVPSIANAARTLGDMFSAVLTGDRLDEGAIASASDGIVEAMGDLGFPNFIDAVRRHHEGTFQHCLIVTGVATAFAKGTAMSQGDTALLTTMGLLHDIGKASIPVEILDKPGKLSPEERLTVQSHPALGHDYLVTQGSTPPDVLFAVRHHHELLDGSGYPDGLSDTAIGDLTRIMTICDIYGALIERRAYKPPMAPQAAFAVLEKMAAEGKLEVPLVRALGPSVLR